MPVYVLSSTLGLQDSISPIMHQISSFHDQAVMVILFIITVVLYIMAGVFRGVSLSRSFKSSEFLETVWTVLPCLVLASLAAPSLVTLYMSDELSKPFLGVKVTGHQWYWSYEYGGGILQVDSYMIPTEELAKPGLRLLECDRRTPIPMMMEVQMIITSSDVIHSWALPSLGVKVDAVPGRLNQAVLFCSRPGVVYGQCSEICGSFHSFMPICLEISPVGSFMDFILGDS